MISELDNRAECDGIEEEEQLITRLKDKEIAFAEEYIKHKNGMKAYKKIYKPKKNEVAMAAASRLLSDVKVKKYLDLLLKKIQRENVMDAQEIRETLSIMGRGQAKEEQIVILSTGDYKSEAKKIKKTISIKDQQGAMKLLCEMDGLLKQVNINIESPQIIDDI